MSNSDDFWRVFFDWLGHLGSKKIALSVESSITNGPVEKDSTDTKPGEEYDFIGAFCGHMSKSVGVVAAFGGSTKTTITVSKSDPPEYCHDCLSKMAIQCAWCGGPIFIGDPVTLYVMPASVKGDLPKYAVVYDAELMEVAGCLSAKCAGSGGDTAGRWLPDPEKEFTGKVFRHKTPAEIALETGQPVFFDVRSGKIEQ